MGARPVHVVLAVVLLIHAAAPPPAWTQAKKPYSIEELEKLASSGLVSDQRIIELVYENGLTFYPDQQAVARLKRAGASDQVIQALQNAEHPPAPVLPPSAGGKGKGSLFKKWWFIGATALVVGGVVAAVAAGGGGDGEPDEALPGFPDHP